VRISQLRSKKFFQFKRYALNIFSFKIFGDYRRSSWLSSCKTSKLLELCSTSKVTIHQHFLNLHNKTKNLPHFNRCLKIAIYFVIISTAANLLVSVIKASNYAVSIASICSLHHLLPPHPLHLHLPLVLPFECETIIIFHL
jgi:hypothetical protein